MISIYTYIYRDELTKYIEEGIDISEYSGNKYHIENDVSGILGYLNPRDNIEKFNSVKYVCIKIQADPEKCFVYEEFYNNFNKGHKKTYVKYEDYNLGAFVLPVVFVTESVNADNISIFDKRKDEPLLYENSKVLYTDNKFNELIESEENIKDKLLFGYFMLLYKKGDVVYKFNKEMTRVIFKDNKGSVYKIDVPKGAEFERKGT